MKSPLPKRGLALVCGALLLLPCRAQVDFQIRESGSTATSATVPPGGVLTLDVVAVSIAAEPGLEANLDSFTYRVAFPNQQFTLQNNAFAAPFDNAQVPGGFNGSIPWSGLPAVITLPIDLGSPGHTPLVPDLYRTTASTAGIPVTGPDALLETLSVQVPLAPGTYAISLNVLEAADRLGALHSVDSGVPFEVTVFEDPCIEDSTPPVVSLVGADPLIIECGEEFVDPGATASDLCDGALAASAAGIVDTSTPGSYTVTYSATDASGNTGMATRTVQVVDTAAPVVVLNGDDPITIECGDAFADPGASATDSCAGTLPVTVSGAVDANTPGTYVITYSAVDPSGNTGSVTRTVEVVDTTPPVITLNGPDPLLLECGSPFVDPGATALDVCAGVLTVNVTGAVDVNTPGDYTLTYEAIDPSGNSSASTRTVTVGECPSFVLDCPDDIIVGNDPGECSAVVTYAEPVPVGAVGVVTIVCNPASGAVFPVGTTAVTCSATDELGRTATCTFTVTVQDTEPPIILCPPDVTVTCLSDVPPPDFAGGSVIDDCDSDPVVTHSGDAVVGANPTLITRTYEAVDAGGNSITCEQIITVVGLEGDLNGDCCVDTDDLDLLVAQVRARSTDLTYDLNGDGSVDIADARWLVLRFTNPGGVPCP